MRGESARLVVAAIAWISIPIPQAFAQRLYWTRGQTNITSADLDGGDVQVIPVPEETYALAVDGGAGKLYWTVKAPAEFVQVQRSDLDGSNVEDLVTQSSMFTTIALDPPNNTMYLGREGEIQRSDLDGSNLQIIFSPGPVGVSGIAAESGGGVYWTDHLYGKIIRSNADGSGVMDLIFGLDDPYGIAIDSTGATIYWAAECEASCPGSIQRADLDGSNVQTIATTGIFNPRMLALDLALSRLYWYDNVANRIKRANTDGTEIVDIALGISDVFGIAVDSSCVPGSLDDFDLDGIPDDCDIDIDNDGVVNDVDVCDFTPPGLLVDSEGRPRGDMNKNCVTNGLDIALFVNQILNGT